MSNEMLEHTYRFYESRQGPHPNVYEHWVRILKEEDGDANEVWKPRHDQRYTSPLFAAVCDESLQLTELVLDAGARIDQHNLEGRTVLHEAVILGHRDMVALLLDRGASVEGQIRSDFLFGSTALHLAVTEGAVDILRDLLDRGANTQANSHTGWNPIDLAILDRQTTALELLLTRVDLSTVAGQATEVETFVDIVADDGDDQKALASHLVEHGVRGTESKHALFFQRCLSKVIKGLDSSILQTPRLAPRLIRDVEAALLKHAGVANETTWPRNLCTECQHFDSQDGYKATQIYEQKSDLSALVSSADNGCNLCHLSKEALNSRWCLLHQISRKYMVEFGVSPKVRVRIETEKRDGTGWEKHRLIVVCGEKIAFTDLEHVQKQVNAAVMGTGPTDTKGTASDRSFAIARGWLQRCEDEHPLCRRAELEKLPKRVIDVGIESEEPRVYISHQERLPYAALSYCWGHDQNIRLLSTSINEYAERLPVALIPQTIADAILAARRMNVQYLWVDSLCILQDSDADLRQELSDMGAIYANAWVTIAAKDSPTCTSGLFYERNWPTSAIVPLGIRLPSKTMERSAGIYGRGRMKNTRTSCTNRLMAIPGHRVPYSRDEPAVLETRAWALQQELLSHRMLNFGQIELSFTCLEGLCTERDPKVRGMSGHYGMQHNLKRALFTGSDEHGNSNHQNKDRIFNYWLEIVENCLRRKLSDSRDRLAAIAGVQGLIGQVLDDEPVVGIWEAQYFARSLLWQPDDKRQDEVTCSYPCPSWSWASASRPIQYLKHPTCTDSSRPWVWHTEVHYFPEVVNWNLEHNVHSIGGCVIIRCKLLREADLSCERGHYPDFLNERPGPKSLSGKEVIHFEVHHDFEDAADISDAWLLPVRTTQYISGSSVHDRAFKHDIRTHLLRLERISPDRAGYRRIGLVETRSWANRWLGDATEEVVRLF